MKRNAPLITLIICTVIVCAIFVVYLVNERTDKKASSVTTSESTVQVNNSGYILKEYKGKIATFKVNSNTPLEVFDVFVSSLPDSEIQSIKNGIYAEDEDELQSLIEAYTS